MSLSAYEGHLRRTYGLSYKEYIQLLEEQNGACAICQRPAEMFQRRLCVDHNHKSGEVRGLLCIRCNREIIGRQTDPELFFRAAEYLKKHTGWFVPKKRRNGKRKKSRKGRKVRS